MKLAKLSMPRRRVRGSADVFGIGDRIAEPHPRGVDADGELGREQIVGDAHLVAIGIGAEGQQRGVLRFPAEAADAPIAGAEVGDDGGAAADAVAVAVAGILEREQRVVVDGLDEPGAEQRDRHAPGDDVGFGRNHRLAAVAGDREQVEQRLARRRRAASNSPVGSRRPARTSATALAPPTAGTLWQAAQLVPLNAGPEPFFARLDLEEVVQPEAELLELGRRDAGERVARANRAVARRRPAWLRERSASAASTIEPPTGVDRSSLARRWLGHDDHAAHEASGRRRTASSTRTCSGRRARRRTSTVVTPRPRLGISTFTSVPTIRKPCWCRRCGAGSQRRADRRS